MLLLLAFVLSFHFTFFLLSFFLSRVLIFLDAIASVCLSFIHSFLLPLFLFSFSLPFLTSLFNNFSSFLPSFLFYFFYNPLLLSFPDAIASVSLAAAVPRPRPGSCAWSGGLSDYVTFKNLINF